MEVIKTPLIQDGKVAGLLGVASSITEWKKTERAAYEAHERAGFMLDACTVSFSLISGEMGFENARFDA